MIPGEIRVLPGTIELNTGRPTLRLRVANLDTSSQLMYRLGHQAIFAAVGIAGGAFALVLEGRGELDRAGWGWWTA